MKNFALLVMTLFAFQSGFAQDLKLKLWPQSPPNQNTPPGEERYYEVNNTYRYENVSEAELYVYRPEDSINTGAAVVICPGGGYRIESIDHEGNEIAKFLSSKGITGIVLKYRLPYGNHEIPITDAQQAIRYVRAKAAEWKIDPKKVGIAGASAGGHLAATAGTHYTAGDSLSTDEFAKFGSRPDFMLLLYPVISLDSQIGHSGTRQNLLGSNAPAELVEEYSNELHVDANTPPTFFALADDDRVVVPANSVSFYAELKKNNVPAEMHIFAKGGHGFGIRKAGIPTDLWPELFVEWMKMMKIIP